MPLRVVTTDDDYLKFRDVCILTRARGLPVSNAVKWFTAVIWSEQALVDHHAQWSVRASAR